MKINGLINGFSLKILTGSITKHMFKKTYIHKH